jgi:hypothetical protein
MSNLHSIETRLKAIQQLIGKLNQDSLSSDELEELVGYTRELYERSVILQYKAYEEKVFGQREIPAPIEVEVAPVVDPIPADEPVAEAEEERVTEEETQPAFDFSLFDEPISEVSEETPATETEEHISVTHSSNDDHGVREERVVVEQVKVSVNEGEASSVAAQFAREMAEISGFSAPLSSLVGAFGLNERLQFINELFRGSSEEFAEAIKELDSLGSADEARHTAARYALRNNWQLDSETVHDFLGKLKRRYA